MPITAVILDWAGTAVDHGSLAPVRTLQKVFSMRGIAVSEEEARRDMGIPKRDHIRALLALKRGGPPAEADVDDLYAAFIPMQMACLEEYATVIPGVAEMAGRLRARGIKIGSTTGYTRPMLDVLLARAAAQGYTPDCALCPEDAGGGRPAPWMCYLSAIRLGTYPMHTMVKIGDTISDIEEGRNAGMWTVAVARTGNMIGLSETDFAALAPAAQVTLVQSARARLHDAGAEFVIDSAADFDPLVDEIEARLAKGLRP